jgi:hypothetical protein
VVEELSNTSTRANADAAALYLRSARTIKPSSNGDVASVLCLVFGSRRTGGDGEKSGEAWPSREEEKGIKKQETGVTGHGGMRVWCECVGGLI